MDFAWKHNVSVSVLISQMYSSGGSGGKRGDSVPIKETVFSKSAYHFSESLFMADLVQIDAYKHECSEDNIATY